MATDTVLSTTELAARWAINAGTLANWRCYKKGPVHVRVGTAIRYRLADILAYERANEISPQVAPPKSVARRLRRRNRR